MSDFEGITLPDSYDTVRDGDTLRVTVEPIFGIRRVAVAVAGAIDDPSITTIHLRTIPTSRPYGAPLQDMVNVIVASGKKLAW